MRVPSNIRDLVLEANRFLLTRESYRIRNQDMITSSVIDEEFESKIGFVRLNENDEEDFCTSTLMSAFMVMSQPPEDRG